MSPEEPSLNTPQTSSNRPVLSRADVAIGSLSRQLVNRTSSVQNDRTSVPQSVPSVNPVVSMQPQPELAASIEPVPVIPIQTEQQFIAQPISPVPDSIPVGPAPTFQAQPEVQPPMSNEPIQKKSRLALPFSMRRLLVPSLVVLLIFAGGGGLFSWIRWNNAQNTPDKIFSDALQANLETTQLQTQTHTGNTENTVSYDFTNVTNPVVSTQQTVAMDGTSFQLAGYGSAKNTYVSYTKFPSVISSTITSQATNGWIQLRSNGLLPSGVSSMLSDASDPRYQTIGLMSFGNFSAITREQLVRYLLTEHIYSYKDSKVTHTTLDGAKVIAYPIKLNLNFLQVYDESYATDEGFSPSDVQDAISALNNWSGAHATFYVSSVTHRFVEIALNKGGVTTTIHYSNYNNASLPGEPETKLTWDDFAPIQNLIDAQVVAHQKADLALLAYPLVKPATVRD